MQDRESIRTALADLLDAEIGQRFTHLADEMKLREELGLDSVDVVSLVSQIERQFHIRLTQHELATMATVGDLLNLLVAKLQPRSMAA